MTKPRFAIVCSTFNQVFTDALLASAEKELKGQSVEVRRVPGAFEIPLQVQRFAREGKYAAILALGVVWEGKTRHAEEILRCVTGSLMGIGLENDVPIIHEVLMVKDDAEARARTMGTKLNRGTEAAETALALAGIAPAAAKKPKTGHAKA